jgi:tRNA G10  N-methylase Trm11
MLRNDKMIFDSIVCDPPYGVRARTQKVGVGENKKARFEERKK